MSLRSNAPLLEVRDLTLGFRRGKEYFRAVDRVSFHLGKGETLAVVGESGCGKSVTAMAILRLNPEPPARIESGEIHYGGRDLLTLPSKEMRKVRGKEIAMIFQEPMSSLNPVMTVGDQIVEARTIHERQSRKVARDAAIEAMSRVGIPAPGERFYDYPHQMSGGMRQRIMIAMALAARPAILVADEPTTALDVTIQAQILELISGIQREFGMGVMLITHDLGIVAEVANRVVVMYAGVVVEMADTKTLLTHPLHPYTRALYRSIPRKDRTNDDDRLETIPGRVPTLEEVPSYCRFAERCVDVIPECKKEHPQLREVEPGHWVRCIRS